MRSSDNVCSYFARLPGSDRENISVAAGSREHSSKELPFRRAGGLISVAGSLTRLSAGTTLFGENFESAVAPGTHTTINNYDAYNSLVSYYGSLANLPQTMDLASAPAREHRLTITRSGRCKFLSINDIPGFTPVPEPPEQGLLLFALALILFGSAWGRRVCGRVLRQTTSR